MKIKISYFYQIRFFKENQIPISTAKWDPLWYHNNQRNYKTTFYDKNNVLNGLRIEELSPGKNCENLCNGINSCKIQDPEKCNFIKEYQKQLNSLDFNFVFDKLKSIANKFNKDLKNIELILIVYETPNNPCSERNSIIEWFKKNGIEIEEFNR